ncbi:MAG: hypothetical protein R3E65_10785 [Steroidobacteraceae bacterium]
MKSVSWALLLSNHGLASRVPGTGARSGPPSAQLIRRRDGALQLAPIDPRLAQAARQRAPAIY